MSIKRQAPSELNHDNWDSEDPAADKEMGQFKPASKDVIEKRVFRTARRKITNASEGSKSVFSGFGGFNKTQPTSFDFLANLTNGSKNTNGASGTSSSDASVTPGLFSSKPAVSSGLFGVQTSTTPMPTQTTTLTSSPFGSSVKTSPSTLFTSTKVDSTKEAPFKIEPSSLAQKDSPKTAQTIPNVFGVASTSANDSKPLFSSTNSTPFKIQPASSTNTAMVQTSFGITTPVVTPVTPVKKVDDGEKSNDKKIKYFSKLKGLNESVSDWISKHVVQTPLCILSPIFKDYEKYLKEITEEYQVDKEEPENSMDVENRDAKTEKVQNTKTLSPFAINNKGASPFTGNSSTKSTKTAMPFANSNMSASPKISTPNQETKTSTPFAMHNTVSSTSQNTKMSSPFAINNNDSTPPNRQDTKTPSPFASATGLSPLTSPSTKPSTPTINNTPGIVNTPLNSLNTKTSPFGSINSESSPFNSSPLGATPKSSLFSAQNNLTSSPENKQPSFSFGIKTSTTNAPSVSSPSTGFSFGVTPSAASGSPFKQSNAPTNQAGAAPFSFGTGKPFSFSPSTVQQTNSEAAAIENEEDTPPKVEYTPVKEENSVYEKKCKIFVKKDGNFVDKGVGTLYIKKIDGNAKHQLLVRANTNLGTVLLNLVLVEAIPTQRMGKNNVMLACIPTPEAKPPPATVLIRVKTGDEADDLLQTLNKYKA